MADTTVTIGADLTQLRRELAKLPNLSTEAAQKTLIQVEKAVQKAEKAAKKSAKSIAKSQRDAARVAEKAARDATVAAEKALKNIGDTAGDTDSSLKAVAGAIGLISPEAEKALSAAGDLAGGLEGVTRGTGVLGGSLGALGSILSVVAIAAAGLVTIYAVLKNASEESAEENGRLAARVEETRSRASAAADEVIRLAGAWTAYTEDATAWRDRIDLINGVVTQQELDIRDATEALEKKAFTAIRGAGFHVAALEAEIAATEDYILAGKASFEEEVKLTKQQEESRKALKAAKTALREKKEQLQQDIDTTAAAIEWNHERARSEEFLAKRQRARSKQEAAAARARAEQLREEERRVKAAEGAWAQFLEQLDFVIEAAAQLEADKSLEELVPDDLIPPEVIRRARTLGDAVDALIPRETLSRSERLTLLLFDLEAAQAMAGGESAILAEQIERVRGELTALGDEAGDEGGTGWAAVMVDGAQQVIAAMAGVADAIRTVIGSIAGMVGAFDQLLQSVAGFGLSDLAAVAAAGAVTRDILDDAGEIIGTETVGPGVIVEEMIAGAVDVITTLVQSAPEVINAFVGGLPRLIAAAVKAIDPIVEAVLDAVPLVVSQLAAAVPGLVDKVIAVLPELFGDLVPMFLDVIEELIPEMGRLVAGVIDALPELVDAVLEALPDIIDAVLAAVGDVVEAVIAVLPDIVLAVIDALPEIVDAVIEALPELAAQLAVAVVTEIIPRLPEIVFALVRSSHEIAESLVESLIRELPALYAEIQDAFAAMVDDGARRFVEGIAAFFRDVLEEIQTLGGAQTASFGDTPGPVRAPLAGLTARFAPGDYVVAAQSAGELQRQAATLGGGGQSVTLQLADGHLAFDRMFRRNLRSGGVLAQLAGPATGQVRIYG